MNLKTISDNFNNAINLYPPGTEVWHMADGAKGVVQGWDVDCNGSVCINIDYGSGNSQLEFACCLSKAFVEKLEDGDQWKKA